MGREFGKLTRVRHVITYSLSPFEQRAFPNYFSKGIPNVLRRIQASILRAAPRECRGRGGPASQPGWERAQPRSARQTHVFSLKIPQSP